jgi:hypothetical protein
LTSKFRTGLGASGIEYFPGTEYNDGYWIVDQSLRYTPNGISQYLDSMLQAGLENGTSVPSAAPVTIPISASFSASGVSVAGTFDPTDGAAIVNFGYSQGIISTGISIGFEPGSSFWESEFTVRSAEFGIGATGGAGASFLGLGAETMVRGTAGLQYSQADGMQLGPMGS